MINLKGHKHFQQLTQSHHLEAEWKQVIRGDSIYGTAGTLIKGGSIGSVTLDGKDVVWAAPRARETLTSTTNTQDST